MTGKMYENTVQTLKNPSVDVHVVNQNGQQFDITAAYIYMPIHEDHKSVYLIQLERFSFCKQKTGDVSPPARLIKIDKIKMATTASFSVVHENGQCQL